MPAPPRASHVPMRPLLLSLALLGALLGVPARGYEPGQQVEDFTAQDTDGQTHQLSRYRGKVVVLVVWGSSCRVSKAYGDKLERLHRAFKGRGVVFLGLAPNAEETPASIQAGKRDHGVSFPVVDDDGGKVSRALEARTTPTAYVIDGERRLRYQGVIDDGNRREPTPYLQQAIEAVLEGRAPPRAKTSGPGIRISY